MLSVLSNRTFRHLLAAQVVALVGTGHGSATAMLTLAMLSLVGLMAAFALRPRHDPTEIAHGHDDLPAGHPHIAAGPRHSHAYVIDDLHPRWPEDKESARAV